MRARRHLDKNIHLNPNAHKHELLDKKLNTNNYEEGAAINNVPLIPSSAWIVHR